MGRMKEVDQAIEECSRPDDVVAAVYDDDGSLFDLTYNWETGQTYANMGYRVVALKGSGHIPQEECQELYDYERRIAADCFGPGVRHG